MVPFLPSVTIRSASLRNSFALATVVTIRSCSISCVTIVRSIAHRWEDVRLNFFHGIITSQFFLQNLKRSQGNIVSNEFNNHRSGQLFTGLMKYSYTIFKIFNCFQMWYKVVVFALRTLNSF